MAIVASGLGSGLDVNSLVSQLVAAERAPVAQRITRRETTINTQVSAMATLRGALSAFKTALDPVSSAATLQPRQTTVGNPELFTASAGASAAAGSYPIEVVRIAKAQQLASQAFAGGAAATVGTGTLTLSLAGESFDVEIDAGHGTLAGIRDAINAAADNTGIQATLITADDGARLVLTSARTGAANEISLTQAGGDGGLAVLAHVPPAASSWSSLRPAADALVRIAGFEVTSSSNMIDGAIDGVSLQLNAEAPGAPTTLGVTVDTGATLDRIRKFVTEWNTLSTKLTGLRSYDAGTGVAGPLLGDAMLRGIESRLRSLLTQSVPGLTGDYQMLVNLGISTQNDGTLKIDETKLNAALAADLGGVARLFAGEGAVASSMKAAIDEALGANGSFATRDAVLQRGLGDTKAATEALDARMAVVEARYRKQFIALDSLLTKMQSTASYLSQQLASGRTG